MEAEITLRVDGKDHRLVVDPRTTLLDVLRANPMGTRGVGEIGIVGAAAAIANGVHHATGRRIRTLPITLDDLL
jgi:CO/xanthine dehydrogenase Mo-binding subunit